MFLLILAIVFMGIFLSIASYIENKLDNLMFLVPFFCVLCVGSGILGTIQLIRLSIEFLTKL